MARAYRLMHDWMRWLRIADFDYRGALGRTCLRAPASSWRTTPRSWT
jgi:hypothetical protein